MKLEWKKDYYNNQKKPINNIAKHALKHIIGYPAENDRRSDEVIEEEKNKWKKIFSNTYTVHNIDSYYGYTTIEEVLEHQHYLLDKYLDYSRDVIDNYYFYYLYVIGNSMSINYRNLEGIETAIKKTGKKSYEITTCFYRTKINYDAIVLPTILTNIKNYIKPNSMHNLFKLPNNIKGLCTNDIRLIEAMKKAANDYINEDRKFNNFKFALNDTVKENLKVDFVILSLYHYLFEVTKSDTKKMESYLPFLLIVEYLYKIKNVPSQDGSALQKYISKYKIPNDDIEEEINTEGLEDYEIMNCLFRMIVYGGKIYKLPQNETIDTQNSEIKICYKAYNKLFNS